jgi:NADH-quinone oxidoreductase subunit D/NADH-quinone oxidoreductase subunit C/D
MWESLNVLEQLGDNIPQGQVMLELKAVKAPKAEYYQRVETARGELGVYIISDGAPSPARINQDTEFFKPFVINKLAAGHKIADSLRLVVRWIDILI